MIVVADDDSPRRSVLRLALTRSLRVCDVRLADLLDACRTSSPDAIVVVADSVGARAVFETVEAVHQRDSQLPVILLMQGGSERIAAAAIRLGIKDYIPFPIEVEQVLASLARCVTKAPAADRPRAGRPPLIGSSDRMNGIRYYLTQIAAGDSNVLITGETGTGKELAAAFVHQNSARRLRPFVPVVCAAIPEPLFESELFGHEKGAFTGATTARAGLLQAAHGGTVFLDEVGDVGPAAQAKMLRAIESREVYRIGGRGPIALDLRIVAATNRDLERAVYDGSFRKDLYFRLNVARIHLPPLRERRSDIGEILDHFCQAFNARLHGDLELSSEVRSALEAYDWPGNVRELKNLVETLFVCPRRRLVRIDDLPDLFRQKLQGLCGLDDQARRTMLDALFAARWNKSRAAEILQCSRMTLYRRMAKYSVTASRSARTKRTASQA
jgi:DNA-binding NtrC family response regulator